MKKSLQAVIILIFSARLFATDFFSGETGLMANFTNTKNFGFEPALDLNGFLTGQLSLSNSLSVRGGFSVRTGDLFEEGLMKEDDDATFRINELSVTLTKSFAGFNHSLSLFKGCFESIGSCEFITRHLGVKNYSSYLTKSYLGLNGANVYDLYGTGLSYTLTAKRLPMAAGFVVSKTDENPEDCSQLNADLRYALTYPLVTMEALAGIGAPLYTKDDEGNDIILMIKTLYFHSAINLLFLSPYSPLSFLLQASLDYFPVKKTNRSLSFDKNDIFLLFETRLSAGVSRFYITAFHFPKTERTKTDVILEKMPLVDDAVGVNIRIFGENLLSKTREYDAGLNLTAGLKTTHIGELPGVDIADELDLSVSPFTEMDLNGGRLTAVLQFSITKFANNDEGALKFHVGYRKSL